MSNGKKGLALEKINFILMGISVALIVVGFFLMSGSATVQDFNPDIFSFRRIKLAPMVTLAGFLLMIVAVIWNPEKKKQ